LINFLSFSKHKPAPPLATEQHPTRPASDGNSNKTYYVFIVEISQLQWNGANLSKNLQSRKNRFFVRKKGTRVAAALCVGWQP
jgi:hypothetical protein